MIGFFYPSLCFVIEPVFSPCYMQGMSIDFSKIPQSKRKRLIELGKHLKVNGLGYIDAMNKAETARLTCQSVLSAAAEDLEGTEDALELEGLKGALSALAQTKKAADEAEPMVQQLSLLVGALKHTAIVGATKDTGGASALAKAEGAILALRKADKEAIEMKASWNGQIIAESEDTVLVEGNHYFPRESVRDEFLRESKTTTVCGWKGTANYYSLEVGGKVNTDAVWYYADPKPAASQIKGRVAFWRGVVVD